MPSRRQSPSLFAGEMGIRFLDTFTDPPKGNPPQQILRNPTITNKNSRLMSIKLCVSKPEGMNSDRTENIEITLTDCV